MRSSIGCFFLACAAISCGPSGDDASVDGARAVEAVEPGRPGVILAAGDTVGTGIVVYVRGSDGSKRPALFRGPRALARAASGGSWEFDADEVPVRVRPVREGERIRSGDGTGGGGATE